MNLQLLRLPTDYLQLIYAVLATVLVVCLVLFKEFGFGGDTVSHHLFTAGHEKNVALRIIVPLTMGFAFTAVYLIAISSTLMLVNLEKTSLDVLKLKLEKFRSSFYVTSMFLCIGIVNVYCLWGWATHATTVTEEVSKASQQIALGYTLSMSIIFSIAFMMLFVPVSLAIRKQLKDKATETLQVDDEEEYTKWKKENGLLNTPYKHFVDGLLLLSPMLVSALTSIVGEFKFL